MLRTQVYTALATTFVDKLVGSTDLIPAFHPDALYTNKDFKKGELRLYPMCNVVKCNKEIDKVMQHHIISVKGSADTFIMQVPKFILNSSTCAPKDGSMFCPYFWVKSVGEVELVNMDVIYFMFEGKIKIPSLVNSKPIKKHTQLWMHALVIEQAPRAEEERTSKRVKRAKANS